MKPMHLGATIVAFRSRDPKLAVVPWVDGRLLDASDDQLDEFPGLGAWWREAERNWDAAKSASTRLSLREQIDFQQKLTKQFPLAPQRVVYTKSGQHLAACRIEDAEAVIDHKLYWATVETPDEGRYVCAVLNSQTLADAVVGLQARGQHNPRDFDMHVFALPFPLFDAAQPLHRQLATLGERAEQVAAAAPLDERWQFQKARRVVREALRRAGVAQEIDDAVRELIASRLKQLEAPDLMAAFSDALAVARARRRQEGVATAAATAPNMARQRPSA